MHIRYQTLPLSGSMEKNTFEKKKHETSCFGTNVPPINNIFLEGECIVYNPDDPCYMIWYIFTYIYHKNHLDVGKYCTIQAKKKQNFLDESWRSVFVVLDRSTRTVAVCW